MGAPGPRQMALPHALDRGQVKREHEILLRLGLCVKNSSVNN